MILALLLITLVVIALILFLRYRAGVLRYRFQVKDLTDDLAEIRVNLSAFNASQRKEIETVCKERQRRESTWRNEVELTRNGR